MLARFDTVKERYCKTRGHGPSPSAIVGCHKERTEVHSPALPFYEIKYKQDVAIKENGVRYTWIDTQCTDSGMRFEVYGKQ